MHDYLTLSLRSTTSVIDEVAISETAVPAWSAMALGALPSGADLTSLHKPNDGRWNFSLDTFATIDGVNVEVYSVPLL